MSDTRLIDAYAHCRRIAFGHYENFPVASLLLPQPQRDAIAAVYAFARQADDYADEPQFAGKRVALLRAWRAKLSKKPALDDLVFIALDDARRRFAIPKKLLSDLIDAFLQDTHKRSYASFKELRSYCRRSADPIGRIVLRVFDQDSARNLLLSDAICTALQLTNHWQDLGKDVRERDRLYLPADSLRRHQIKATELRALQASPRLRALIREEAERAEAFFLMGQGLPAELPWRLGLQIRLTLLGGRAILRKIRSQGFDTLARRPSLGVLDVPGLLLRALLGATA